MKQNSTLGQGAWRIGDDPKKSSQEIAALRKGLDLGMSIIDTAEIYADGTSEEIVGEAIKDRRKEAYLVTKVAPYNATKKGTIEACERSLKRLKTDYIDLYLLHWKGSIPFEETLEGFQILKQAGKILDYGVSNFDLRDMKNALKLPGGNEIISNQVLYNLESRNIEWDLLPWCVQNKISIMAYTPFGEDAKLLENAVIKKIASKHSATPAQVILAWILSHQGVVVIPKSGNPDHVEENHKALKLKLSKDDFQDLDTEFPPPSKKRPLEVL